MEDNSKFSVSKVKDSCTGETIFFINVDVFYILNFKDNEKLANQVCELLNSIYRENIEIDKLHRLCNDYNIRFEDIYDIVINSIEEGVNYIERKRK